MIDKAISNEALAEFASDMKRAMFTTRGLCFDAIVWAELAHGRTAEAMIERIEQMAQWL